MKISCKETEHRRVFVEPPGTVTWTSNTGAHWEEEVGQPACVHIVNAQGHHTSCYSVNGGNGCSYGKTAT